MRCAVLVPVKGFSVAKRRLASMLTPAERAELARWMAARVLAAAAPLPRFVVCDDRAVARWASREGAGVLWRPGRGLNGAVRDGVGILAIFGFDHVIVSHSDLPLAHDLASLATAGHVTLVPDRHADGTNVIAVPARSRFRFRYGARSFASHQREAERLGLPVLVLRDTELGWDVDTPEDAAHPAVRSAIGRSA